MECKGLMRLASPAKEGIGIYPEWNVKATAGVFRLPCLPIGIYPEWNVKQ